MLFRSQRLIALNIDDNGRVGDGQQPGGLLHPIGTALQVWIGHDTGHAKGFGGGGKSVEHPIYALKGAGIQLVLADSFARYNFRNSINKGLPVFVCEGLKEVVSTGDDLTVDMTEGFVVNERTGMRKELVPLAPFVLEILNAGGLLPYTRKQLGRV